MNRGVKSLHLMAPMARKPLHNRDVRQWDLTVKNVSREIWRLENNSFFGYP